MTLPIDKLEEWFLIDRVSNACPYLPDRESTLLYLDGRPIGRGYRELLDLGYRRSGPLVYRTDCGACRACQIIRVPIDTFRRSKSQRRTWNRGQRLFTVRVEPPTTTVEKIAMYGRYLRAHHGRLDREVTEDEYRFFFEHTSLGRDTREVQLYAGDRLAGVGLVDRLGDALSSVYFYNDPDFRAHSPGTYSALVEIELARHWGMRHYYLGYYVAGCGAMEYKARFRPCEIRTPDNADWVTL